MRCYCYWKNNQCRNICFASVKLALIKSYHLRMCYRILLWFEKWQQWNRYVNGTIFESNLRSRDWQWKLQWNCHVNRTNFQGTVRLETGLSSLWVYCKLSLNQILPNSQHSFSKRNCDNQYVKFYYSELFCFSRYWESGIRMP